VPPAAAVGSRSSNYPLAWVLFLLLNATLFMRPAEIVPELEGMQIYEVIILACLAACLPAVLKKLDTRSLRVNPITLCVLGMLPAVMMSHLSHGDLWSARVYGVEFAKVIVYFLLLVTLVNSPRRLRQFLIWLAVFALVLTSLAVLRYHHLIDLNTVAPMTEHQMYKDPVTHKQVTIVRLQAAGIYGNPNDLARILVVGITICLFMLTEGRSLLGRLSWAAILSVFGVALHHTYSRGGLLALIAGVALLFQARLGPRKSLIAFLLLLPALLFFGDRQTDFSTSAGTGQERVKLWSTGLVAMRESPLFGIGRDHYKRTAGNHAHNSFVETYVETGFFGGTMFLSASWLALTLLYRSKPNEQQASRNPELYRLRPYVLSLVGSSIVGQLSSARGYSLPTYMILGLAAVWLAMAAVENPAARAPVSQRMVGRLLLVSAVSLMCIHLYTKFTAHF